EWITLAYFFFFGVLAWTRRMPTRRRWIISMIAIAGTASIIALRSTVLRDWLPLVFIPLAYFQTGQFVLPLHQKFQSMLESVDRKLVFSLPRPLMFVFEL